MTRPWHTVRPVHLLVCLFTALVLAAMVMITGAMFSRALERTVIYKYLDEALTKVSDPLQTVTWGEPVRALDRDFAVQDQTVVGRLLSEAWQSYSNATATHQPNYLKDGFSGPALARAEAAAQVENMHMVTLHQDVRPSFFHMDGSLLQVRSDALVARFAINPDEADGPLQAFRVTDDQSVSILVNEAHGWRIFGHELRATRDVPLLAAGSAEVPKLAGFNYYPANSPWTTFWPQFDADVVARDFALIRGFGANSVRVFLQRAAFLDPKLAPGNLRNLERLLQEADKAGLKVVPTLFDMRPDFRLSTWANDYLMLQDVLPILAAAPNVAYVDLKNEPDLDYAAHGRGLVDAWLMTMAAAVRRIEPGLKVTIGWSSAEAATRLVHVQDLITYHDYHDIEQSAADLQMVRAAAGGKPVHITEIGASSWAAVLGLFPHSPHQQGKVLQARLDALAEADGVFIWTLHDFPEPDPKAIGRSPWRKGLQGHYGMIHATGEEKPAAQIVRKAFETLLKDTPQ